LLLENNGPLSFAWAGSGPLASCLDICDTTDILLCAVALALCWKRKTKGMSAPLFVSDALALLVLVLVFIVLLG
jgi:hypothetical protein